MNWSSSLSWLGLLAARDEPHGAEADRADMGTAFGLDASMAPFDAEPPATHGAAAQPMPWEHRLTRRSSL